MASDASYETPQEQFVEQTVIYILETGGRLVVIGNVPARVSLLTGEQLFSPETVARLQQTVWENQQPMRMLETPVFKFVA